MPSPFQFRESSKPIIDRRGIDIKGLELAAHDLEIDRDVVYDQSAQLLKMLGDGVAVDDTIRRFHKRDYEPESRTHAQFTGNANLTTHALDQLLADRQAKARATEPPCNRAVGLTEFLEQAN